VPTLFESVKNTIPKPKKGKTGKGHMGPFTSYALNPDGVRFETQVEQETVVLFLRQHIIVNIPWILAAIAMVITPTVLLPLFFRSVNVSIPIPGTYIFVGTIFWYVATFGFVLAKFLGWFINIYIVTNERIVDIDFYYLLYKHFAVAELNKIQDISYASKGIFAMIFNYGDVLIQTAGEAQKLTFEKVPHPDRVVEAIRDISEKHTHSL
jgi:uncharacterized membrane protein YdbT with pleckstrin-like domain